MRWDDLDGAVWTIPAEKREKGNAGKLVLPDLALEIINAQPRYVSNPYVFAGDGGRISRAGLGVSNNSTRSLRT